MAPRSPVPWLLRSSLLASLPMLCISWSDFVRAAAPRPSLAPVVIDNDDRMDVNHLDMAVTNHGSIAYDLTTGDAGLLYPAGTPSAVVFAAGLWIGAKVNGGIRIAAGEYAQEYGPGPMAGGTFLPDQFQFRNFRIDRDGTGYSEYLAEAVPQGAPVDADGDPLQLGDALIWCVFNDANPDGHHNAGGSTEPLGVEVQQSVFAFNRTGPLGDVIFVKWRIENKGANQLDSAYVSFWADPDVGGFTDDLVGCDTTMSLGYAYNATNSDGVYGATPPAVGFHMLRGATENGIPLGMTSFIKYINGTDPNSALETYHHMSGRHADGSPIHVCEDPLQPVTRYAVSGLDPGAPLACPSNWLDSNPADRRLLISSGPFTMAPGDTQVMIVAIEVGRSSDRIASIDALRGIAGSVQALYDAGVLDPPTAVQAFLLESHSEADAVRLAWLVPLPAGTPAVVERRTAETSWDAVGEREVSADRVVRFEDTAVTPGGRYAYRLSFWTGTERDHTDETWIEVPLAPESPTTVRLLPGRPNPSTASFRIRHYVPRRGVFQLSVLNVQGRVIRVLENRQLVSGWHDSAWDGRDAGGNEVASGVYLLRVEGEGEAAVQKVVLMR